VRTRTKSQQVRAYGKYQVNSKWSESNLMLICSRLARGMLVMPDMANIYGSYHPAR